MSHVQVTAPSPSLEQLKKQAKDLCKAHRSADPKAAHRIKSHLPRLIDVSETQIPEAEFSLQEAQHVISREYGYTHWEMLRAVVLGDLDTVVTIDDLSTQVLLREVDQRALAVALQGATDAARERFLSVMSVRARGLMEAQIESVEVEAAQIESTRRRMLQQLANLATAGQLEWPFDIR